MSGEVELGRGVISRPDWTMTGVRMSDRFVVLASKDLTEAELRAVGVEVEDLPDGMFRRHHVEEIRYHLTATLLKFVWVTGDSYADALARLFEFWDADGDLDAIEPQKALTP